MARVEHLDHALGTEDLQPETCRPGRRLAHGIEVGDRAPLQAIQSADFVAGQRTDPFRTLAHVLGTYRLAFLLNMGKTPLGNPTEMIDQVKHVPRRSFS